jgi:hypothetical protein
VKVGIVSEVQSSRDLVGDWRHDWVELDRLSLDAVDPHCVAQVIVPDICLLDIGTDFERVLTGIGRQCSIDEKPDRVIGIKRYPSRES